MTVENTQSLVSPDRETCQPPASPPGMAGPPSPTLENAIAGMRLVLAMGLHPNEKLRRIHNLLNELDAALRAAGQSGV